jgi:serine/threonine protein kinase
MSADENQTQHDAEKGSTAVATSDPAAAPARSEDGKSSKKKGRPHLPFESPDDQLGNYEILTSEPLEQFNSKTAKAFKAVDPRSSGKHLYALVCCNHLPTRLPSVEKLAGYRHPNFITPLAHGVVPISSLKECRMVFIYEMPQGVPLSQLIANGKKLSEKFVIKEVLLPLSQILEALQQRMIIHGKINPDNLYYHESGTVKIKLGECFSEPCGYAQSYYYEPIERSMAMPLGRGMEDHTTDYFAMGVLILHILLGFNPLQGMKKEEYFETALSKGMFNTLVGNREFSGMVDDLLKGLFAESQKDRWGATQLRLWLGGKKYNLLRPSPPREAPRPFQFDDEPYFNRKHLAYNFWLNWSSAKRILRNTELSRWLELSVKDTDLASSLSGIVAVTGGKTGRLPTDDDDLTGKSIILLDPYGPLRLHQISTHLSGIGPLLAKMLHEKNNAMVQLIIRLFQGEFTITWADAFPTLPGFNSAELIWFIEKRRHTFKMKNFGFGTARILYDLNPSLPCQSALVQKYYILNEQQLLYLLESLPVEVTRSNDPVDEHIAAFLASKMDILKSISNNIDQFPHFKDNKAIKGLALLAHAQRKNGNPSLPQLSRWFAERLKPVIQILHSKSLRKEVTDELYKIAQKGNLAQLHKLLTNVRVIQEDMQGFRKARMKYFYNSKKIEMLNSRGTQEERADILGQKIASMIAYSIALLTVVFLAQDQLKM